jgi:hypothetical protein
VVVKLEITPEPSEDERAVIVAAVAQEAETPASAWPETVIPWRDDAPEP